MLSLGICQLVRLVRGAPAPSQATGALSSSSSLASRLFPSINVCSGYVYTNRHSAGASLHPRLLADSLVLPPHMADAQQSPKNCQSPLFPGLESTEVGGSFSFTI